MKLLNNVIRFERLKRNYTQEYVADEIGISQSQYSRIEKGEKSIDVEKLGKLAQVLKITPFDLLELYPHPETNHEYKNI